MLPSPSMPPLWVWERTFFLTRRATSKWTIGLAIALIVGIAYLDAMTGARLRLFPLYFVPVALVALGRSARAAVAGACLGTLGWALPNYMVDGPLIYSANVTSQAISFSVIALLVHGLRKQVEHLETLSRTDSLTQLLNSRAFQEAAHVELSRQRRTGTPLTVAYLDLDDFKAINERLGHVGADAVLSDIGRILRTAIRSTDVAARLGGDEFAIILPNADVDAARLILERLRQTIDGAMQARVYSISFSVGAVTFTDPAAGIDMMLAEADRLMYQVKAEGKGAITIKRAAELVLSSTR